LTPRRGVCLDQQSVDRCRQRCIEVAAQRRTHHRAPPPVNHEVGSQEKDPATPPTEERQNARLAVAGQSQEGRPSPRQQRLDLAIGDLHRLGFEPEITSCRSEPAPQRLIAMP